MRVVVEDARIARNGQAALQAAGDAVADTADDDLALLDRGLPKPDGLGTTRVFPGEP
jgi:DNA-binding response OmpR family regulator